MEIAKFLKMMNDKSWDDYKVLSNKYPKDFDDYLKNLQDLYYTELPLKDHFGSKMVYLKDHARINVNAIKGLLEYQNTSYSSNNLESEIIATSAIENIEYKKESVKSILKGHAPKDEAEKRIKGLKKGFEFIADPANEINEENIYALYMMAIGNYLSDEDKPKNGFYYRDDAVYVVGSKVEHTGIDYRLLPQYMRDLVSFVNSKDAIDDLSKACIIHFYIAYLHPWFDGNGRMARLLHLWFLIQKEYLSTLFIPFSIKIDNHRKAYYDAYKKIERNHLYTKKIDVTPFISFFADNVYNDIEKKSFDTLKNYRSLLKEGQITEKEASLWNFVLSQFSDSPFSTKELEKAYGNAAYATIRSFVLKFSALGLLETIKYTTKNKYKVRS